MARNSQAEGLQRKFFDSLSDPIALLQLFESVPDLYLYIKNVSGQYMRANRVVCRVVGVENDQQMIGRTDFDFFPPAIAAQYVDEDRRVIDSNEPLSDQIWLVPDANGIPQIYQCNKVPLTDRKRKVIGIAGLKRPYRQSVGAATGHERLIKVVEYVTHNYAEPISVADLAKAANLSSSQLHREFSARFEITPNQYVREVRIGVARRMLETESMAVADIASHCGFYDQSHLTRQFKASTGLTPLQYRKRFNSAG